MSAAPVTDRLTFSRGRGRIWRMAKWGGLVACVLIAAVFVASLRWYIGAWSDSGQRDQTIDQIVSIGNGAILICTGGPIQPGNDPAWTLEIGDAPGRSVIWSPRWPYWKGPTFIFLPLWMPFAVFAFPTAFLFYLDRPSAHRARNGLCIKCGYDRRGLAPDAACPECGAAAPTKHVQP